MHHGWCCPSKSMSRGKKDADQKDDDKKDNEDEEKKPAQVGSQPMPRSYETADSTDGEASPAERW